jgi:hypothetical protein
MFFKETHKKTIQQFNKTLLTLILSTKNKIISKTPALLKIKT